MIFDLDPKYQFKSTTDLKKVKEIFTMCGSEWSGPLGADEFANIFTSSFVQVQQEGVRIIPYYIEDTSNGKVVASTLVTFQKSLYKPADRSHFISSVPDPNLFGVKNVVSLLVSFVFTNKEYRKQGLAGACVSRAIRSTEDAIIDEKIEKSIDSHDGNFKKMTLNDSTGHMDKSLADYYLGKEYVWVLYSGVNTYYERFGFKSYPLDFYQIPTSSLSEGQLSMLSHLTKDSEQQATPDSNSPKVGKRIRFLDWDSNKDKELIEFILQTKELEILSELNKLVYHTELQSSHRSATSLTNMSSILAMSKLGSGTALSSLTESKPKDEGQSSTLDPSRRKSSALNQTTPKFAVKPSFDHFKRRAIESQQFARTETAKKYSKLQGAILTNDLQQRSYYILWNVLKGSFFITGMGEISYEGILGAPRRRDSSLTGLNELGGYNFQDLDLLISAAVVNAQNRGPNFNNVFVATTDLPSEIPAQVLYDFFLNYLPFSSYAAAEHREQKQTEREKGEEQHKIELIANGAQKVGVLPMVRQFGSDSIEFELDWLDNGMWCWG
ncbi:uncharacterized protein LODBEIA_P55110 [Lodderomyces beijingensis]|uniref:N-acetyltransferase domain-containing protein n=1 Tax=Lodderomyces beijingensis TaxID=1775926 RepID=A0ABP0ZV53_9ASCO